MQTEDSGVDSPHVFTHMYLGGVIIASAKADYSHIVAQEGHEPQVKKLMQEQHKDLMRQLRRGAFDDKIALVVGDAPSIDSTDEQTLPVVVQAEGTQSPEIDDTPTLPPDSEVEDQPTETWSLDSEEDIPTVPLQVEEVDPSRRPQRDTVNEPVVPAMIQPRTGPHQAFDEPLQSALFNAAAAHLNPRLAREDAADTEIQAALGEVPFADDLAFGNPAPAPGSTADLADQAARLALGQDGRSDTEEELPAVQIAPVVNLSGTSSQAAGDHGVFRAPLPQGARQRPATQSRPSIVPTAGAHPDPSVRGRAPAPPSSLARYNAPRPSLEQRQATAARGRRRPTGAYRVRAPGELVQETEAAPARGAVVARPAIVINGKASRQTLPSRPAGGAQPRMARPPTAVPAARARPANNPFGADPLGERSLDEVILGYLAEEEDKGPKKSK